jgi:Flp pilus assembly protein TadB
MRKFRLSTLMLLVVIAALTIALVMQDRRAARREAELRMRIQDSTYSHEIIAAEKLMLKKRVKELQAKLDELGRSSDGAGRGSDGK